MRKDSEAVLLDAGTGASRLLAEPRLLDGVDQLHVVLTHFHLDHIVGLFFLVDVQVPFRIWGAGEALEGIGTAELVQRLVSSPFAPPSFASEFAAVEELTVGTTEIGTFRVRSRVQRKHGNPTLALRLDDAIAWCTDTAYDGENAELARGVRVLGHEAFHAADRTDDPGHSAAGEAARLAAEAGVGRLLLIHVNPDLEDDESLLAFARPHFAATDVGVDGLEVD